MLKRIPVLILLFGIFFSAGSQESYQKDFLVFHNMMMKPDTMLFSFWYQDDTLNVKRIIHQHVPMESTGDKVNFSFRRKAPQDAVEGSKLFNGKRISYSFGTEKYLVRNDTLYKFVQTNRLSRDSLDVLFGHGKNPGYFNKIEYRNNLQIIKDNRIRVKKILFFSGMFDGDKNKYILQGENCADTIFLRKRWEGKDITYYAISVTFNCLKYKKEEHLILDDDFQLHAFDKKYLDKQMKPFVDIKPFKGIYFLKK